MEVQGIRLAVRVTEVLPAAAARVVLLLATPASGVEALPIV